MFLYALQIIFANKISQRSTILPFKAMPNISRIHSFFSCVGITQNQLLLPWMKAARENKLYMPCGALVINLLI